MKSSGSSWGHCTALVTVAWFATATWTAAFAADPPTKAPAAKQTKTKAKPISRDQLRACMDQQDVINSMREKVLQQQASLDQQRAEVARMDAELDASGLQQRSLRMKLRRRHSTTKKCAAMNSVTRTTRACLP